MVRRTATSAAAATAADASTSRYAIELVPPVHKLGRRGGLLRVQPGGLPAATTTAAAEHRLAQQLRPRLVQVDARVEALVKITKAATPFCA